MCPAQMKKGAKVRPEGYDTHKGDGRSGMILSTGLPITEFVLGSAPVKALGEYNNFTWDENSPECQLWKAMPQTSEALLSACQDLKLLGKKDFRMLLTWRLKAAEKWKKYGGKSAGGAEEGSGSEEEGSEEEGEEAKEVKAEEELTALEKLAAQRQKTLKRKEATKRRKMKERLELQMEHPGE